MASIVSRSLDERHLLLRRMLMLFLPCFAYGQTPQEERDASKLLLVDHTLWLLVEG